MLHIEIEHVVPVKRLLDSSLTTFDFFESHLLSSILIYDNINFSLPVAPVCLLIIRSEVVPGEESVFETVALFSVHSMIAVVGADQVAKRTAAISQLQLEVGVGAGRVVEGVEGEGEGDGMQVTDLSNEGSGEGEREGGGMDVVDSTVSPPEDTTEGGKSTEILDSTSGPEGNAEHPECEEERHLTLKIAVESFDDGKVFKGVFQNCKNPASFTPVVREKTEQSVKKSIQLLTQLSVSEPFLLNALFNLYGAALSVTQSVTTERKIKEMGGDKDGGTEGGADGSAGDGDGSVAVPSTSTTEATAVKKVSRVESKYTVICDIIEAELSSIIPIISKRQDSLSLFSALTRTDSDPCIRPLLEITLEIIHTDYTLPASPALIEAVKAYTESRPFALSMQNHDLKLQLEKEKEEKIEKNEDISEIIKEIEMANAAFEEEKVTASLRLFFPLLGGFSAVEILDLIPRLLKTFSDEPEVLKNVFKRIYSARPPALSKATLFAALHRYVLKMYIGLVVTFTHFNLISI